MDLDFTAIDFETANNFRGSACSVGLVKVRQAQVVEEAFWLIKPPQGYHHFDAINMNIHGISPQDVMNEPDFEELFPDIGRFIGDDMLVAHNAAFDMSVIRAALEISATFNPAYKYFCSVLLARRVYDLPSYSLPVVAAAAGVDLKNHHDALEDARACASIVIDIAQRLSASSVKDLLAILGLRMSSMPPIMPNVAISEISRFKPWPVEGDNPEPNSQANPAHPLFGQTLVFTGELEISRQEAKCQAASFGASTSNLVTEKTSVLVVGKGLDVTKLGQGILTGKAKTVLKLQAQGKSIRILPEEEFLSLINVVDCS